MFGMQEAEQHNLYNLEEAFLYNLEEAFDSVEHCVLLFEAGINGKAWRLIRACNSNLTVMVKSESTLSAPFAITQGVQQSSVLSPTYIVISQCYEQATTTAQGLIGWAVNLRRLPWGRSSCR